MHTVYPLRLWRSLFLRWLSLVLAVMGWGICTMAHAANMAVNVVHRSKLRKAFFMGHSSQRADMTCPHGKNMNKNAR